MERYISVMSADHVLDVVECEWYEHDAAHDKHVADDDDVVSLALLSHTGKHWICEAYEDSGLVHTHVFKQQAVINYVTEWLKTVD